MNEESKQWLLTEFPTHSIKTLRGETLSAYYRAEMLLNGWDRIKQRSCSCQYRGLKNSVDGSYKQWLQNEENLHN